MAPKVPSREKRPDRLATEAMHRKGFAGTPGGTRIPNLLIRSQRGAEQPHAWESVAITVFGLTRAVVTSGPRGV